MRFSSGFLLFSFLLPALTLLRGDEPGVAVLGNARLKDLPRLALDPKQKRFAVGTKERIVVVELG
jgi:hypothetical protein